jgi:hypothetical protein
MSKKWHIEGHRQKEQHPEQHPNQDPNPQVHGTNPRDLDLDPYKNGKDLQHCFNHLWKQILKNI